MDLFVLHRGDLHLAIRPEDVERFEEVGDGRARSLMTTSGVRLLFERARLAHGQRSDFHPLPSLCRSLEQTVGAQGLFAFEGQCLLIVAPQPHHAELIATLSAPLGNLLDPTSPTPTRPSSTPSRPWRR